MGGRGKSAGGGGRQLWGKTVSEKETAIRETLNKFYGANSKLGKYYSGVVGKSLSEIQTLLRSQTNIANRLYKKYEKTQRDSDATRWRAAFRKHRELGYIMRKKFGFFKTRKFTSGEYSRLLSTERGEI